MPKKLRRSPAVIIAVDPGEAAGIAVYVHGQYVRSWAFNGRYWSSTFTAMQQAVCTVTQPPGSTWVCVCEDGYGRGLGAKTLDRRRGKVEAAAEACGIPNMVYISPSQWQAYYRIKRGEDTKVASTGHAKMIIKYEPYDHNEADAVCLGRYAADKLKI